MNVHGRDCAGAGRSDKAAQRAGIAAKKYDPKKYRGKKPSYSREAYEQVLNMLAISAWCFRDRQGDGVVQAGSTQDQGDPAASETALVKWGL